MRAAPVAILAATAAVFVVSGLVTQSSVGGWYQTLAKPSFNPPDWVFGPVWTVLYIAMAVAGWLAWRGAAEGVADGAANGPADGAAARPGGPGAQRTVLAAYFAQLALNALWTVLFFGLQRPGAALVEGLVLLGCILWTIRVFAPADRRAAWAMAPYAAWVAFAMVLNGAIVALN